MFSRTLPSLFRATVVGAALLGAGALQAQEVQVFGGNGERAHATRFFFTPNFTSLGGVCIQYGQPLWKADYDAMVEKGAKNQRVRLGKDYWTTLSTDVDLQIGDTKLPAGSYLLGLMTDAEGGFWLAILDAAKAFKAKAVPFNPATWKVDHKAKLTYAKVEDEAEKLTIAMDVVDGAKGKLTLKLHWGGHALTAPMVAKIGTDKAQG